MSYAIISFFIKKTWLYSQKKQLAFAHCFTAQCDPPPNSHRLAPALTGVPVAPAPSPDKLRLRLVTASSHNNRHESVRHLDKLISIYCYLFSKPLAGNKTKSYIIALWHALCLWTFHRTDICFFYCVSIIPGLLL